MVSYLLPYRDRRANTRLCLPANKLDWYHSKLRLASQYQAITKSLNNILLTLKTTAGNLSKRELWKYRNIEI